MRTSSIRFLIEECRKEFESNCSITLEEFVDKYVKLLKKAQNGDTSVITEYTECLEKAESFQSKLEGAKADLTMKQVNRLNRINSKSAKASLSSL